MKTVQEIQTYLDDIADWEWLFCGEGEGKDIFAVSEDFAQAAKLWGISENAVKDLHYSFQRLSEQLIDAIRKDLKDIWEIVNRENEKMRGREYTPNKIRRLM